MIYIIKEPNKPAEYGCIEKTDTLGELHALQALVGGNIEVLGIKSRFAMIVNAESRINDMAFNLTLWGEQLFGPVIFIGVHEGDFTDLPFTMCELKRMIPHLADQPSKDGKPNADGWVAYNRKNEATYPDSKWVLVQDWNAFMYGAKFDRATGGWLDLHDEWHSGDSIAAWRELPPVYKKGAAQ